jgi:hypothetical protein
MRAGWNPTRRNRNVGTKAHGHGQNNKLKIPQSWWEAKVFYEKLSNFVVVTRQFGARKITFVIEPTMPDWFYPCTIDDISFILAAMPPETLIFDLIVMRQPTRKQRILSSVWGRAIFDFDINQYSGSAIVIEAQTISPFIWSSNLSEEYKREFNRLQEDGHGIRAVRRGHEITPNINSLRNTLLYRTLLHEIGHHVDYQRSSDEEWDSKTSATKEDFAHRYASEQFTLLKQNGVVPFDQLMDELSLQKDNLKMEWFSPVLLNDAICLDVAD